MCIRDRYKGPLRGGADMYNLMIHSNPVLFPAYYPADDKFQYAKHILFGNHNNSKINPYAEDPCTPRSWRLSARSAR